MTRTPVTVAVLAAGLLQAAAAPAFAGPREPRTVPLAEETLFGSIPTVISASRHEQGINEAPASITIVTAQEIRRFGYRTLADVLRHTRGFYVSDDRNYQYAGVRGFGRPGDYSNRLLVMIDGHSVNERWTGGNYLGQDFGLDLDLVDRIEIVRGPASALYGSNALLAVINLVTRPAGDLPGLNLKASGGSFRSGAAGLLYGRAPGGGTDLLAGASGFGSSGQDLFYPEFDDPSTSSGLAAGADGEVGGSLFGRLRVGRWTILGKASRRNKQIPTASYGTMFGDRGTYTSDARSFAEARMERITKGGAQTTLRFYYDHLDYYGDYVFDYPPVTVNRDEGGGSWLGAEYRWSRRAARAHLLSLGGQYEYILNVYQRNFDEDPFAEYLDEEFRFFNYSLYAQDEVTLGPRVLLNLGLRYDNYQTYGASTSPRAALIVSPRRSTTLKALFGSAFRAPSIYELFYEDGGLSSKPNPGLDPERIRTLELVWEQGLGRRVSVVASAYRYRMHDLIGQVEDPSDMLLQFNNVESVTADGLEVEVYGRTAAGIHLRGAYTAQRAEDDSKGLRLSNSPAHIALASATIPLLNGRSDLAVQARYLSRRITLDGDRTRAVAVADLAFTSGSLWPAIGMTVGVRNLLDRDYGDPGGNEHAQDQIPQDGRTFFVTLRHRF